LAFMNWSSEVLATDFISSQHSATTSPWGTLLISC
jgi:hypothetical protein